MRSDQTVGVGGVTHHYYFDVSGSVVVDGFSGVHEDLSVVLQ